MENGHSQALLVEIDEVSRESEEMLQWEPIPLGVVWRLFKWESKNLWRLSWASIVIQLMDCTLSIVTQIFVGHLGNLELAGAAIATMGTQGVAYGILLGMASAVQTVCGQAYGARKYNVMGIICQRAMILHIIVAIALCFLYWYAGPILCLVGQKADVAAAGQTYARGQMLQLIAYAFYLPMQRFLQAQTIVNPMAYMSVAVLVFHTIISYLAVFVFKFGLLGAALALSISWWVLVVLMGLYIILSPSCKATWTGLSMRAFNDLWSYTKFTCASAVMQVLAVWYMLSIVLLTGFLPNSEIALDSLSICFNYATWYNQIMLGLANVASIRIGNELGSSHPRVARFAVMVVLTTSVTISIVVSALVLILKTPLSKLSTSSTIVMAAVANLTPLLSIYILLNGIHPILSGVAIGSGWQTVVAYVNFGAYYIIGLPVGFVLGFKTKLAIAGIFWGLLIGVFVQTVVLIILTARAKWDNEVEKAAHRVKHTTY